MAIGLTIGEDPERIGRFGDAFDFVEIGVGETAALPGALEPAAVRDRVTEVGCSTCVHLPFKQELATPVPELNDAIAAYLGRLLAWAGEIEARYAVVHATARNPSDTDLRPTAVAQLEQIAGTAADHGVTITVENVGHQSKGFPLSVVAKLADAADVPLCFDVGHAYMENGDDAVERGFEEYGDRISYLHVHDVRGRGDTHLPIGAGEVDWEPLVSAWPAIDADLALEIFTDDRDHLTDSAARLQRLLEDEAAV